MSGFAPLLRAQEGGMTTELHIALYKARDKSPAIALPLKDIRWSGLASIADVQPIGAHFGVGPIPLKKTGSNSLYWR
jgi:hypothetical protein